VARSNLREKLSKAVRILATHPGRIQERLGDGFAGAVGDIDIKNEHPDVRMRVQDLQQPLHRKSGERSIYRESALSLTDDEAVELAHAVLSLEYDTR
jgi:hypothetical protein